MLGRNMNEKMSGEIIWLENPKKWPYLREISMHRKKSKILNEIGWKLIGYETILKTYNSTELHVKKVWFLQKWDVGCPEDDGRYSNDNIPIEGVKTKEMKIPEGTRVIKAYKIDSIVPEYKTEKEKIKILNKSKKKETPYIAIRNLGDYALIEYEMFTSNHKLKKEACQNIRNVFTHFLSNLDENYRNCIFPYKKDLYLSIDNKSGILPLLRVFECRILSSKISKILYDKNNWKK